MGRGPALGGGQSIKPRKTFTFAADDELAEAINAFLISNNYTVSEGLRILFRTALSADAQTIVPEAERLRAYRDLEYWARERLAASFGEIKALMEAQNRELRMLQAIENPPQNNDYPIDG